MPSYSGDQQRKQFPEIANRENRKHALELANQHNEPAESTVRRAEAYVKFLAGTAE